MFEIKMAYKNSRIHLKLNQKVNVIVGDSATGKTTAIQMLYNRLYQAKIKLQDDSYSIQHFRNSELVAKYGLQHIFNGKYIVIADESDMIFEDWVYDIIHNGKDYYFILVTRTYIPKLKFGVESLWRFTEINKITRNVPFYDLKFKNSFTKYDYILTEDSGYGFEFIFRLFNKLDTNVYPVGFIDENGEVLQSVDINENDNIKFIFKDGYNISYLGSKDKVAVTLSNIYDGVGFNKNILLFVDLASFGSNLVSVVPELLKFNNEPEFVPELRCLEYLLLNTNMLMAYSKEYTIAEPCDEEVFYEQNLENITKGTQLYIKHGSSKLPSCFYEVCCHIKKDKKCNFGVRKISDNQFINLLNGTKFEFLLNMARRS